MLKWMEFWKRRREQRARRAAMVAAKSALGQIVTFTRRHHMAHLPEAQGAAEAYEQVSKRLEDWPCN